MALMDLQADEPEPPGNASEDIERLFREHNEALMHFVAAKVGSEQEAREITQEAYVRLLSLDRPEAVSYLRAFLYKTAANLATDRIRQRHRKGQVQTMRELPDSWLVELSPERLIESEQVLQALHRAIDELPDKCRQAFLMHCVQGFNSREIAARLGLRERMARLHVARAVEYLRMRLDELGQEGGTQP